MTAAQARPAQSLMLALLDKLHYVFLCNYTERPIADTKSCVSRYLTLITVDQGRIYMLGGPGLTI